MRLWRAPEHLFAFVPPTLLLSELRLVEARMWYLNLHLQANFMSRPL